MEMLHMIEHLGDVGIRIAGRPQRRVARNKLRLR
jgi:hypothetical protein